MKNEELKRIANYNNGEIPAQLKLLFKPKK